MTRIMGTRHADVIHGTADDELISGGNGNDELYGGGGGDTLIGGAGHDALFGNDGDDLLNGGYGDRIIDGAAGSDHAFLQFATSGQSITFSVADNLVNPVDVAGTQISGIERITFAGSSTERNFISGGTLDDTIVGGGHNDALSGGDGNDRIGGGAGHDIITGGRGADKLLGGDGNDIISGATGEADVIDGGAGDDLIHGGIGNLKILGGSGTDTATIDFSAATRGVSFSVAANLADSVRVLGTHISGIEQIYFSGGSANDRIEGGALADQITGGDGNDVLLGGGGDDQLAGEDGVDQLTGGAGNDGLYGGTGLGDTAVYSGLRSDYVVTTLADGGLQITDTRAGGGDGVDTLYDVEFANFADGIVSIADLDGSGPPVTAADHFVVSENSDITILDLLGNDSGNRLEIVSIDPISLQGSLGLGVSGNVFYSPLALFQDLSEGQRATQTFRYTVRDANGQTATQQATIDVVGVNDRPTANADAYTLTAGTHTTVDPLANDQDLDISDHLTLVSIGAPESRLGAWIDGADHAVFDTSGTFVQSLGHGQAYTETFFYAVSDHPEKGPDGWTNSTITVTVIGQNDGPVANADHLTVESTGVTWLGNVLANDVDPDTGDRITLKTHDLVSAKGATISIGSGGRLTYDAGNVFDNLGDAATSDSFSYTITDQWGATSTATATLTVAGTPPFDPRLSSTASITEGEMSENLYDNLLAKAKLLYGDSAKIVAVRSADAPGALTFDPERATLTFSAQGEAFDHLLPDPTFTTSFVFVVEANGLRHAGRHTVEISGINDDPTAIADRIDLAAGGDSGDIYDLLLANDLDVESLSFIITGVDTNGTMGQVTFDAAHHTLHYEAIGNLFDQLEPGEVYRDHFSYTMYDTWGGYSTAEVTIDVTADGSSTYQFAALAEGVQADFLL